MDAGHSEAARQAGKCLLHTRPKGKNCESVCPKIAALVLHLKKYLTNTGNQRQDGRRF
jgi:hypothetical protein